MKLRRILALSVPILAISALVPESSEAQFNQYVAPGEFEIESETREQQLDRAIQEARWHAGRFYLDPWVSLRDFAYIDNVGRASEEEGDKQSDVTAKLGLGLQGYAPIGSEVTFAFHALPEYVWWKDLAGRRGWIGHYGAGFFGDLGRTGFEATIARADDTNFFSRELETPVDIREDRVELQLDFELFGPVSLDLGGYGRRLSYGQNDEEDDVAGLERLNRDEAVYRASFKIELPRGFELGLGAEFSDVTFDDESFNRSNTGTSPILQLDFHSERFTLESDLAFRDLEPKDGSTFVPFDDMTGRAQLAYRPAGRSEIQLFWNNNLVYSRSVRWSYFTDESVGVALLSSLGSSTSVRAFYETGDTQYITTILGINDRTDDFNAWGVTFRFDLGAFVMNLGATQTDYDSNLPEFDRKITVIRTGLSIRGRSGFPWT